MNKFKIVFSLFIIGVFFAFTGNVNAASLTSLDVKNATMDKFSSNRYEYDVFIDSDTITTNIDYTTDLDNYSIVGGGVSNSKY